MLRPQQRLATLLRRLSSHSRARRIENPVLSVYGGRRGDRNREVTVSDTVETDYRVHEVNKFNGIRSWHDRITPKIIQPNSIIVGAHVLFRPGSNFTKVRLHSIL